MKTLPEYSEHFIDILKEWNEPVHICLADLQKITGLKSKEEVFNELTRLLPEGVELIRNTDDQYIATYSFK